MNAERIEVGAGLVFHAGALLLARRPAGGHLGGLWEFPGGKREPGEGWEDCVVRELREELGIEVAVGELFDRVLHDYPERAVELRFFLCRLLAGEPRALGCDAFAWVHPSELARYPMPPADRPVLERLLVEPDLWKAAI